MKRSKLMGLNRGFCPKSVSVCNVNVNSKAS